MIGKFDGGWQSDGRNGKGEWGGGAEEGERERSGGLSMTR